MIVRFVSQHSHRNSIYQHTSNLFISKKPINVTYVIIKTQKRVIYPHMSKMFIKRVRLLVVLNVTNLFKRVIWKDTWKCFIQENNRLCIFVRLAHFKVYIKWQWTDMLKIFIRNCPNWLLNKFCTSTWMLSRYL